MSEKLTQQQRLKYSSQFRETYEQKQRWFGKYMVLWLRSGDDTALRLGVVASKKVGNAIKRARAKRLLREAFRRNRWQFATTEDVVLVARRSIITAGWNNIVEELLYLAEQAGVLREVHEN